MDPKDGRAFLPRLKKEDSGFLLHLSEGVTSTGIHAAGMLPEDFEVLAQSGGSIVWSPLSNLLV